MTSLWTKMVIVNEPIAFDSMLSIALEVCPPLDYLFGEKMVTTSHLLVCGVSLFS